MVTKKVKIYTLLALICGGLAGITCKILQTNEKALEPQGSKPKEAKKAETAQEHLMIVFVHGTIFNLPYYSVYNETRKEQKKHPEKTFFKTYKKLLRRKSLYSCQPINDFGLIEIDPKETDEDTKNNRILANIYKSAYESVYPNQNREFHFYTFGWDGELDKKSREKAGFKFYEELEKELTQLKNKHKKSNIKLEILTHSHGGNVVLNFVKAEEKFQKKLSVDKLIMLGVPVQSETCDFVNNPIFKKIYNIYSRGDTIQVIDIFSSEDTGAKRRFKDSNNLVQIEVKAGKMQPSHTELWLLEQDKNLLYREDFPLNPLPVFVFSPIITHLIENNNLQIKNLNLQLKVKDDGLKFNFYDDDLKRKHKKDKSIVLQKYSYKFKNFVTLKTLALSPPLKDKVS